MDLVIRNFPDGLDLRVFIDRVYPHLSDDVIIEQCNGYDAEAIQQPSMKKIGVTKRNRGATAGRRRKARPRTND